MCSIKYTNMNNSRILKDLKVFIVDDDYFCCNVYKHELMHIGLTNFYLFDSGEECLKNMTILPDIILLDYDMATLDGLQVIKTIKKNYPTTDIVMISGRKENHVAMEALEYGATTFILKDGNEMTHLNFAVSKIVSRYARHFSLNKHIKTAVLA